MTSTNDIASWFSEYYYSYKGLKLNAATQQSNRMGEILARHVDCETSAQLSCGQKTNLCGVLTEIAAAGIIHVLTYPQFKPRISTSIEDALGADIVMYNGKQGPPNFSIDAKMGKAIGPVKSKKLRMPIISLSFPEEQSGITEIISKLGDGDLVDPYSFYRNMGINGLRESGMLNSLQTTASWILRGRLFTRSNGCLMYPKKFLDSINAFQL